MNKSVSIIILLLCIISVPFIYIYFTEKDTEIVVLPGLAVTPVTTSSTTSATSTYTNTDYGFSLEMPPEWAGFSVATSSVQKGTLVALRHPKWSESSPHMDIPILIYPIAQWKKWIATNFDGYQTAAPIPPTERGRNEAYVFATAPRYNYSFLPGFEQVEQIILTLKGL